VVSKVLVTQSVMIELCGALYFARTDTLIDTLPEIIVFNISSDLMVT
jgi:hypothetical protein